MNNFNLALHLLLSASQKKDDTTILNEVGVILMKQERYSILKVAFFKRVNFFYSLDTKNLSVILRELHN